MTPLWPWQLDALERTTQLLAKGYTAICVTMPTGMGKSRTMAELAKWKADLEGQVVLYTNRRFITKQAGKTIQDVGIEPGFLAANFEQKGGDVRVASLQTVLSRVGRGRLILPKADLVIIDEVHGKGFLPIEEQYKDQGTPIVSFTATPVDLGGRYQVLLQCGTKAQGRAAGSLVPCMVFAPTEPDMQGVKMTKTGEYVQKGMAKRVMQCVVFADVLDHWRRLNPFALPTILFAPGVPESRWFVQQFREAGVTAEHIDGDTDEDERTRITEGCKDGSIKVISSYGVLREGVDLPFIAHGILVQVCGAYSTYLQIVGRLLRAYPGKTQAVLQDHSGAWHRHGSPNLDWEWKLGDTDKQIAKTKLTGKKKGLEPEPICCPNCGAVRKMGPECPQCSYKHTKSVRMVRTLQGELKRMVGDVVQKKKQVSDDQKAWTGCLFRCAQTNRTVAQARGLFIGTTGHPLPHDCKPQPDHGSLDWSRKITDLYPWFGKKKNAS